jgi:hypothetical protein
MKQTEVGSTWHAVKGHAKLPSDDIREALYNLLVGFHGSHVIHKLAKASSDDHDVVLGLISDVEEVFLQEKMIYAAIRLRILDDYLLSKSCLEYEAKSAGWIVGGLGELSAHRSDLDLREACNKIIHADLFNWIVFGTSETNNEGLAPRVNLYGKRGKKKWRASIDILKFIRCAAFQLSFTG